MRLNAVAIHDRAADAFNRPFFVPALGMAIRSFQDEINRNQPDNPMYAHPDDFDLYQLGYYDEDTGLFTNNEGGPKQLAIGKQLKVRD